MDDTPKVIARIVPSAGPVRPTRLKKEEQQALAKAVQLRVLLGRTQEEIAEEFRLSLRQVRDKLKEARADGGAKDIAEVIVLKRLLPKAVAVFDAALSGEDVPKNTIDVAKDVLFGSGTLKKKDEVAVTHELSPLEAYRRERDQRLRPTGEEYDGDVIDVTPPQLTEGTGGNEDE